MSYSSYSLSDMPVLYARFQDNLFMAYQVKEKEIKRHLRLLKDDGLLSVVGKRTYINDKGKRILNACVYRVSERYVANLERKKKIEKSD